MYIILWVKRGDPKYFLSPPRERIEVRGTLESPLPIPSPIKGEGKLK
jgi:hypothetical protein